MTTTVQSPRASHGVVEKLTAAFQSMLEVSQLTPQEQLTVLRGTGERVVTKVDDSDAAFERVRLRSIGVGDEIRNLEGGGVSDADLAGLAGVSRETVRSYRERGKVIAWPKDARNLRYPAWQAHSGTFLPGLAEVFAELAPRKMAPLAIADYFLSESDELEGQRPLDLLRSNRVAEVIEHARRYGDIGS